MNDMSYKPAGAKISLSGQPIETGLAQRITQVVVRQSLDTPALAEITIVDPFDGLSERFAAGTALGVDLRTGGKLFSGAVAGLEHHYLADGGRVLKVRAHDALETLRSKRRFRVVEGVSPVDAWSEAASGLGLDVRATVEGTPCTSVQTGTSDLTFLVSLARAQGIHAVLDGEAVRLVSLAGFGETIEVSPGGRLIAVKVEEAGEDVSRLGRAYGWSAASAGTFAATAPTARQDEEIELSAFALSGLHEDEGHLFAANLPSGSQGEVQAAAQDMMDRSAANQTVATGTLRGSADFRPGVRLRLAGLGFRAPPTVVMTTATHVFDARQGNVTEFSSRPPPPLKAECVPVVTLGRVIDIADPDGGARVKVALPAFGDIELGFLSLVVAGAGAGKGAAALPDVGDDVIVLFPSSDLAHGLVLGGIYGAARLPRGTTTQHPRALVLASGGDQRLVLGGARATASLLTSSGDRLSLGGGRSQLTVAGDLEIAAIGGTITIKAQKVNFERI